MVRLYLSEISDAKLLGSQDPRYIRKWCEENKVDMFTESNKSYVNHSEFELAYNRQFVLDLMKKFPDDWEQRYTYYNQGDVLMLLRLKESYYQKPIQGNVCGTYKPQSEESKARLNKYKS